jgi:hypothetical protein
MNNRLLRETVDFEDYDPLHRYECSHNDDWSWRRDGKKHWHAEREIDPAPVVEVDLVEQVCRALDGLPIINYSFNWDNWYKKMMRK